MDHLGLDGCTLIANLWGIVFWILQSGNGNYKGEVGGGRGRRALTPKEVEFVSWAVVMIFLLLCCSFLTK